MIKRFFCIFVVLITVFSFSVSAEEVEEVLYSYTGEDLYNDISSNSTNISDLKLVGDTCSYSYTANAYKTFNYYDTLHYLTGFGTYRFRCDGSDITIQFRIAKNIVNGRPQGVINKSYIAPFEIDLKYVLGFYVVITGYTEGSLTYFNALEVSIVPDVPPESGIVGDSSDFHNIVIPFVQNLAVQTWDVFSSSWWALAFILMPLVYLLIISFIKLFSCFLFKFSPKYRIRYLNRYKNNYKLDYKDKNSFDFGRLSIFSFIKKKKYNKNNNDFKRFVFVDGEKYYRSNSNLKKIHTFKKDTFVEKTKYHNKKYDVDIDVEDS